MQLFLSVFVLLLTQPAIAQDIVHAEGRASTPVAEHVVRRMAKGRANAMARSKCRQFGHYGIPTVIPGTGYDTAYYRNRMWYGHYFADFQCH